MDEAPKVVGLSKLREKHKTHIEIPSKWMISLSGAKAPIDGGRSQSSKKNHHSHSVTRQAILCICKALPSGLWGFSWPKRS